MNTCINLISFVLYGFSYEEFHPFLFKQLESKPHLELPTFDRVRFNFRR